MILVTSTAVESMPVNSEVATATGEHNIYTCPHTEWFQETLHSICKLTTVLNTNIKLSLGLGFVQTIFEHIYMHAYIAGNIVVVVGYDAKINM